MNQMRYLCYGYCSIKHNIISIDFYNVCKSDIFKNYILCNVWMR